jgi:MFS family permease
MLSSTLIAGFLTDTFGRKTFIGVGLCGIFLFTSLAASSQTFQLLVTAEFFVGVL